MNKKISELAHRGLYSCILICVKLSKWSTRINFYFIRGGGLTKYCKDSHNGDEIS